MQILDNFVQGSDEWFAVRNGKITMSNAKALLTGGKGVTRSSYLQEVAAEILAGWDGDNFQTRDMIRGTELEPFARRAVEKHIGEEFREVGFVLSDHDLIGCSPDALSDTSGLEIKCPLPKHHLRYLDREQVARDHGQQVQGELWVCERDVWVFASFCPQVEAMPLIVHLFERDSDTIKKLEDSALRGAEEVKAMVKAAESCKLNDDVLKIAHEAAEYWQAYNEEMKAEVFI